MLKYISLILYICIMAIGAITAHYTDTTDNLKMQLSQANRTINLITTHRAKPVNYLFTSPMAGDDFKRLTSPYGYRELINPFTGGTSESVHKGVDILGTFRARIIAVGAGTVIEHYPPANGFFKGHPVLGGMIKIDHGDGWSSVYGHLSTTYVYEGQIIEAGAVIGRQGNTGQSYGAHLHFELQYNNETVQVLKFVGGLE